MYICSIGSVILKYLDAELHLALIAVVIRVLPADHDSQ